MVLKTATQEANRKIEIKINQRNTRFFSFSFFFSFFQCCCSWFENKENERKKRRREWRRKWAMRVGLRGDVIRKGEVVWPSVCISFGERLGWSVSPSRSRTLDTTIRPYRELRLVKSRDQRAAWSTQCSHARSLIAQLEFARMRVLFDTLSSFALLILISTSIVTANLSPAFRSGNTCIRQPEGVEATKTPGDNGYRLKISGNPDKYFPGEVYTGKSLFKL